MTLPLTLRCLLVALALGPLALPAPLAAQRVPDARFGWHPVGSAVADTTRRADPQGRTSLPRPRFGPVDPRRKPFMEVGAVVGGIAGAACAIHESRQDIPVDWGRVLLGALMIPGGMVAGALAGYVVSLPFVH
jgi:hypothetical protein